MLKKTITFTDYNGVSRTEDHYFNLNDAELMKLELGTVGGLSEQIKRVMSEQDVPTIMEIFDHLIDISYGRRSADGREFEKSEAITRSFKQTEAYSKLFMELVSKEGTASEFVNGIISRTVDASGDNVIPMPTV